MKKKGHEERPTGKRGVRDISRRQLLGAGTALPALALFDSAPARAISGTVGGGANHFTDKTLTIFNAGSLAPALKKMQDPFHDRYGAEVNFEVKGSVASTKKITALGRHAGVLAVSDYRLLRDQLLPKYGSWYAIFATNAMTIQYRKDSPGASEINQDNWWKILSRKGVRIGHSDPATDPGGYRAVMTMKLGAVPFHGKRLYDQATYKKLKANSIVPTSTEINLLGQLKAGKLDYVLYYRSISVSSGLPFIGLPPTVDLSVADDEHAHHYAQVKVETHAGTFKGAPIAYGVAVPRVAANPALGNRWVAFMLSDSGNEILKHFGFVPVAPGIVPVADQKAVPSRVMQHAQAREKLGSLKL